MPQTSKKHRPVKHGDGQDSVWYEALDSIPHRHDDDGNRHSDGLQPVRVPRCNEDDDHRRLAVHLGRGSGHDHPNTPNAEINELFNPDDLSFKDQTRPSPCDRLTPVNVSDVHPPQVSINEVGPNDPNELSFKDQIRPSPLDPAAESDHSPQVSTNDCELFDPDVLSFKDQARPTANVAHGANIINGKQEAGLDNGAYPGVPRGPSFKDQTR